MSAAQLARLLLALVLLAAWQAALAHPIGHASHQHEESTLCGALDALAACAPHGAPVLADLAPPRTFLPSLHSGRPRVAPPPPFLAQGPPART